MLSCCRSEVAFAPVLTADVRFEGFSQTDWSRLLHVFRTEPRVIEPSATGPSQTFARGGLVVVHDGGRARKVLHTQDGRIDPRSLGWPRPLDVLAADTKTAWVLALHVGALEELMERFGARIRPHDDVLDQALLIANAARELMNEGAIELYPRKLAGMPLPTRAMVDRAIDAVLPEGKVALLALYDGEGDTERHGRNSHVHSMNSRATSSASSDYLWTVLALRRAHGRPARFDLILGPGELRKEMGFLSGEFRRDQRHLHDAVESIVGPIGLGLHAPVDTFRRLLVSATPGDWARAVGLRDVVLHPIAPVLALPLGLDAGRGVYGFASRLADALDPIGVVQPLLAFANRMLPELPGRRLDLLGIVRRLLAADRTLPNA